MIKHTYYISDISDILCSPEDQEVGIGLSGTSLSIYAYDVDTLFRDVDTRTDSHIVLPATSMLRFYHD